MKKESTNLSKEMIESTTAWYYSCFCGVDISKAITGIHFIPMEERENMVKGYGCRFLIYMLHVNDALIITYAPSVNIVIDEIRGLENAEKIIDKLSSQFLLRKSQLMIFGEEKVFDFGVARMLNKEDYPAFEIFFRKCHPNMDSVDWLKEYFDEKAGCDYLTGCFVNEELVSVCDAPDMPYLQGKIQHTGIETLRTERKKGYAKYASALATHNLLERGICPQWECDYDNYASKMLAKSIGYLEFGVAYILEDKK